jgi:hypothetical protein
MSYIQLYIVYTSMLHDYYYQLLILQIYLYKYSRLYPDVFQKRIYPKRTDE